MERRWRKEIRRAQGTGAAREGTGGGVCRGMGQRRPGTPEPTFRPARFWWRHNQGQGPFLPFKNHRHPQQDSRAKILGETEALWALPLTSIGALFCVCGFDRRRPD